MADQNEIVNTADLAEEEWDGLSEPNDLDTDMTATKEATNDKMEFHVQMHGYTLRDMDNLIVEAAARLIVGQRTDTALAKQIEERCAQLITEQVDAKLKTVTAEIIDQPLTPKYPFMKADAEPMTMREFIGLTGREYLAARVDNSGKPTTDPHYSKTRIQRLVESHMDRTFKNEIEKATRATIIEIQNAIKARHAAILDAEKKRVHDAIRHVTGEKNDG